MKNRNYSQRWIGSKWWPNIEARKAHEDIPEGLGIGVVEKRNSDGELLIYFKGNSFISGSQWVVLGKFAKPRDDGGLFYVSDRTSGPWTAEAKVTYHEDLLMAVSWIVELKERWERTYNAHVSD